MELRVDGLPIPQGSKSAFPFKRANGTIGVAVTEGKKAPSLKEWRGAIAAAARVWIALNGRPAPLDCAVVAEMTFYLPRPASAPKRVTKPTKKPDLGKLARAAEDALTKIAYADDSRITTMVLRKRFAIDRPPGVEITLREDETR
jgi:Holliday junction resolvase RusA-like endonuclease